MIERFNFYDVYGYLVPGFLWLLLLALPFHSVVDFSAISAAQLTVSLVVAYAAGHYLSGLARQALPTGRYPINGEMVQKSVAFLSAKFPGKNPMAASLKESLGRCFKARFDFNPIEPFDVPGVKQMFFLCRASLSHAKLGAYVEQYQGMTSLTRNLAFAFCLSGLYYAAWVVASAVPSIMIDQTLRAVLPLATLAAGMMLAELVKNAANREAEKDKREVTELQFKTAECLALAIALVVVGAVSAWWYPLNSRQSHQMAIAAALLYIASVRMKSASESFDESLVLAVYRDFVVLSTAKAAGKSGPPEEPEVS